ncbi:caveolin-1-like [Ruditapes philippinarum]|uniref:caveolin-1-like n=1 Tax=Ruditapes philippinarum TaxID=129788 RepID=UPI00295B66C4|nr:caveolin-1-like [Ruditapes philippinarum]
MGVDLDNRDPNELNGHIKVQFEDVLGEPEGIRSMDCVWKNSYSCFECGKNLCYKILTFLCGLCIALEWGCCFAGITFQNVWCCTPFLRAFSICMGCAQKFFGSCLSCCVVPVCESCGALFSKIKITKG